QAELTTPLSPDSVRRLCDYHFGVGSDGVLEILAVTGTRADVRIWNPDGSTAELSGNGARIVAAWLARRVGEPEVQIRVGGRRAPRSDGRRLGARSGGDARVGDERGRNRGRRGCERLVRNAGPSPPPRRRTSRRAGPRRDGKAHRPGRRNLPDRTRLKTTCPR